MALFWRLFLAVAGIGVAVVTLFVVLAVLQFNHIHSELARERLAVLADRTAAPFEAAARIGLPLQLVRNADSILERARQMDDAILAIRIVSAEGEVLHATDVGRDDLREIPGPIRERGRWSGETDRGFYSGISINDRLGVVVGGLLIEYSGLESSARNWAMAAQLAAGGVLLLAGASLIAGPVLRFGLRREIASFDAIEAALSTFEREAWRSTGGSELAPDGEDASPLLADLCEAEAQYRRSCARARS